MFSGKYFQGIIMDAFFLAVEVYFLPFSLRKTF